MKGVPIFITLDGRTQNILGWSRELSMSPDTIRRRHARGLPPEEILRPGHAQVTYTYDGRTQTQRAWAKELGITPSTLSHNVSKHGVEGALKPKGVMAFGKIQRLSQHAKEHGMSRQALDVRLARGMQLEEALTKPLAKVSPRTPWGALYAYKGQERTWAGWAKVLGCHPETLRQRYLKGWSVAKVLGTPVRERFAYKGQKHTWVEWAKILKCNPSTLRLRHRKGWPIEKVLGTPVRGWGTGTLRLQRGAGSQEKSNQE